MYDDALISIEFYSSDPPSLMSEILTNVCKKHGISNVKKLNYLNAFVLLLTKNTDWKSPGTFGFTFEEIVSWLVPFEVDYEIIIIVLKSRMTPFPLIFSLRIALIQDSVQVRAAGLRALRYAVRSEENVISLNKLHFPYLIAR